jgi:hypothetical protein
MVNRYRIEAPARGEKVAMAKPFREDRRLHS